jgi:hypothetical protein
MDDPLTIVARPTIRCFLLWVALLFVSVMVVTILTHVAWLLEWLSSHPTTEEQIAEYLVRSVWTCTYVSLIAVVVGVALAAILGALLNACWEAGPEGIAIYRKGHLSRRIPWEEVDRVRVRPMGIRLLLRKRVWPMRLSFVPPRIARTFARYCDEQIRQGPV